MKTAGILLAAGRSLRFGDQDKLMANLGGRPLVRHAVSTLVSLSPDILIAVASSDDVAEECDGFQLVRTANSEIQQSTSLRLGILAAQERGASRALVMLADMPFVTTRHLQAVLSNCTDTTASASGDGVRRMPPACFPAKMFPDLAAIAGETGARSILKSLPATSIIVTNQEELHDIDTQADLESAMRSLH